MLFFLCHRTNSLPLGKLGLCRTMRSRSRSCTYLDTLFWIHGFLSCLSHSVEQALGWATVQRVLLCHKYRKTDSKNAKRLGWWHWDAEGKPFSQCSYKSQFSRIRFHKLVTPKEELSLWASKHPASWLFPMIVPGTPAHRCWVISWTQAVGCGRAVRHYPLTKVLGAALHPVCRWKEHQHLMEGPVNWTLALSTWFD